MITRQQLDKLYNEFEKDAIEYIKDRTDLVFDYGFDGDISDEEAKEILYKINPDGGRENTLREQGYLYALKEILNHYLK